jgi:heptosyltransferase-2
MVALFKNHARHALPLMVRLPNWVGDVVMCLPALNHLNTLGIPIVICGRAWAKPLIQNIQFIEFVSLTGSLWHDVRAARRASLPNMLGLTFPDSLSSALVFRLAGLPTMGYRDDGRSWLLKWPVNKLEQPLHAVEKWFYLADTAVRTWQTSITTQSSISTVLAKLPRNIHITLLTKQVVQARELLTQINIANQPYILIAPTATGQHRGQLKVWPHFAALTQSLQQLGFHVVACPPKHERAQAQLQAPTVTLIDSTDLGTFAALARSAALVICNDSGVSHVAAAVCANQITLFGVTDPDQTGPWSKVALRLGQLGQWPNLEVVLETVKERLTLYKPVG